mmetsp:Transcript_23738/g.54731  ORF Transcript_23738/g.54731 Transcript_23738/m.54731 type:complete len:387 (+) Transcript_23738:135-1295(+)
MAASPSTITPLGRSTKSSWIRMAPRLVCVVIACMVGSSSSTFTVTNGIMQEGTPDQLGTYILTNDRTGDFAEVIWESGGRLEQLNLNGHDVLITHQDNATMVRENPHWRSCPLVPFANRIRDGEYSWPLGQPDATSYSLPLNEVSDDRSDALHGFLCNKTLELRAKSVDNEDDGAMVAIGYEFEPDSEIGYPFHIDVTLIYKLTSDGITVTVRVVNKEDQIDVPLTISWHPYLAVQDVSQAVIHSACPLRHVVMGDGAPRHGDLIPTGNTETWDDFDGTHQVGGNSTNPTYMDDEFRLTPSIHACPNLEVAITDVAANNVTTVLFADPQFRYLQIYTGAMENWGESSIAVEPMVGKADAFNNGDGLQVLSADTTFEGTFGFKVRQA